MTGAVACGMALTARSSTTSPYPFEDAQKEVAQLSAEATVTHLARSKDPSAVIRQHKLFRLNLNAHGFSFNTALGMTIITETLMTHQMAIVTNEQKAHLVTQLAVPPINRHMWASAWSKVSALSSP